jgi:hypothetical protein
MASDLMVCNTALAAALAAEDSTTLPDLMFDLPHLERRLALAVTAQDEGLVAKEIALVIQQTACISTMGSGLGEDSSSVSSGTIARAKDRLADALARQNEAIKCATDFDALSSLIEQDAFWTLQDTKEKHPENIAPLTSGIEVSLSSDVFIKLIFI